MRRPAHPPAGPGRESVWDYPRPPALEPSARRVRVVLGGVTVADSTRAQRVLETSHPLVYYVAPEDAAPGALVPLPPSRGDSVCEWKGAARYHDVLGGDRRVPRGAWSYPDPSPRFRTIRGWIAFYPGAMDACYLDEERVRAQEGDFYGGWITDALVGLFKGAPGTWGW